MGPRGRKPQQRPIDHVRSGVWPEAELDGDVSAAYAQDFAYRLEQAIAGRSHTEIGELAGVSRMTVSLIVAGKTYPTLWTIARLEAALGPLVAEKKARLALGRDAAG